ncbi:MAG: hypothetical protein MMC33_002934 [Icmadophila ericetorum]|nr:hypothetical protein [Icmadophila ericetorum]
MSPLHRMGSKDKLKLGLGLRLRVGVPLILLLGAALAYFIAQTAWAKKRAAKSPQTGLIPGYRQPKAVKAPPPNGLSFEAPSNSMIHGTPDRLIVEASPTGPRGLMSSKKRLAELTRRYLTTHFFGGTIQRFNPTLFNIINCQFLTWRFVFLGFGDIFMHLFSVGARGKGELKVREGREYKRWSLGLS